MPPTPAIVRAMREAVGHHQSGRFAEAERIYSQVLQQSPRDADALHLLGLVHHQTGRNESAVELIARAIRIRPMGVFYLNLSQAQRGLGRNREALDSCQRAVQMEPKIAEGWNNLGSLLKQVGRAEESLVALQKAVELNPRYVFGWNNLGNTLASLGRAKEAEAALRRAIELNPSYSGAYISLSLLLTQLGRLDEAIELCQRAIALEPNSAPAYANLGVALHTQGRFDEGNEAFARALRADPNHALSAENLLAGMSYSAKFTPAQVFAAHVDWAQRFADSLASSRQHPAKSQSDHKLRIGYISPDFKRHSVAYFLEPILQHHDRSQFEIFAYANVDRADEVTQRLRGLCDQWRDIIAMSDDEVAEQIRQDEIDVLIDLAGHTVGNRLLVFARKPAAVQVTYLGYPETTGLRAIDWRITDELADPPGMTEQFHAEKLWRVPAPFVRYRPPEESPEVADAPRERNGFVTFGSFNKSAKVGPETIALWAKALSAVEGSRLIMKATGLNSAGSRRRFTEGFARHAIDPSRIELVEANQPLREHLAMYGRIDVALDTFPYHGTTTTCEALWMGVSVVSLVGQKHVSRVGLSLLSAVGHGDWAVASPEVFTAKAAELASLGGDHRQSLRKAVAAGRLTDAGELTKSLELAYQQMVAQAAEIGPVSR